MATNGPRVLLAGDGHGALATYRGLVAAGHETDVCTRDSELATLASKNGSALLDNLGGASPRSQDIVLLAGHKDIVNPESFPDGRLLNIHYSLLPLYRGFHSVVWGVLNDEEKVGYSVHHIDALVDHGDIVWQRAIAVEGRTSWELMLALDRLVEAEIGQVIHSFAAGAIAVQPQNHDQATFVGRRNLEDCRIDWRRDAAYLSRFLRALVAPYPLPFFKYKGQTLQVTRAEVVFRSYQEVPGRVVYRDETSVWIKLSDGLLRLYEVRTEDGRTVPALQALPKVGARLELPPL
jgi:methionyl-tRNA formyltransferase